MKIKINFEGPYKVYNFIDNQKEIGNVKVALKKGWNQLHIEVKPEFQQKGYSVKMIKSVIDDLSYCVIPYGRITNENIHKVVKKVAQDNKYSAVTKEIFGTKEYLLFDKSKISEEEIDKLIY